MWKVSVTVDDKELPAVAERIKAAPGQVRRMVGIIARGPIANTLIRDLSQEPGKRSGKVRWKSDKQRKAYFASNGFGKGIPYRRSHKLAQGWRVVVVSAAKSEISVENSQGYTRFVQGDDQQPFHSDTGWRQAGPIINRFREPFEDALVKGWYRICGAIK
jgi:hypothetical protein